MVNVASSGERTGAGFVAEVSSELDSEVGSKEVSDVSVVVSEETDATSSVGIWNFGLFVFPESSFAQLQTDRIIEATRNRVMCFFISETFHKKIKVNIN